MQAGRRYSAGLFPRDFGAQPLFLLPQLRSELVTEVGSLKHLPDFDFALLSRGIGAPLRPLNRLLFRLDLPQPETGDQFLSLSEWSVNHGPVVPGEADACAL